MIRSHRDLLVWQMGMALVEKVYKLTTGLPRSENWRLVSQMRRAAISVPSNIAEGYGRNSTGAYLQFLHISHGSLLELETQLFLCERLGYGAQEFRKIILNEIDSLRKMMGSLISKVKNSPHDNSRV